MSEKIVVVDSENKVIGSKERSALDYDVDIYRSTGIWITNSKNEVLIAQRKFTKDKDPGKWGPAAAGTVDEGETYETNAYKELEEELGITGIKLSKGPEQYVGEPRKQFIQWYTGIADIKLTDLKLQEEEVEVAKWVHIDDLIKDIESNPGNYVSMIATSMKLLGF